MTDELTRLTITARLGAIEISLECEEVRISHIITPFKARELCLALADLSTTAEAQMPTF